MWWEGGLTWALQTARMPLPVPTSTTVLPSNNDLFLITAARHARSTRHTHGTFDGQVRLVLARQTRRAEEEEEGQAPQGAASRRDRAGTGVVTRRGRMSALTSVVGLHAVVVRKHLLLVVEVRVRAKVCRGKPVSGER